jgi:energy-coupling factor transporter ATP-binding protein EcfA2
MKKATPNLEIFLISFGVILLISPISEVFPFGTTSSRIELKAWADKLEIGSDEDVVFTVEAAWEGELDRFEIEPIRPPQCKLFEILGSSSVNETKIVEGKTKTFKTFNFVLRPTQQGEGEVGGVEFRYVDPITKDTSLLSTQPIAIQIGSPVKKEGGDAVIYLVLILLIFFTSLTYFVIRIREKESKEEKIKTEEKVEMSLEEETSAKLSSLEPLLSGEKIEESFSQISKAVTRYLGEKYHIMTTGKTTPEIMASLSVLNIDEKRMRILESILKRCDLAKFAKEKIEKEDGKKVLEDFKTILEQS